jgi:hypothetical protein
MRDFLTDTVSTLVKGRATGDRVAQREASVRGKPAGARDVVRVPVPDCKGAGLGNDAVAAIHTSRGAPAQSRFAAALMT